MRGVEGSGELRRFAGSPYGIGVLLAATGLTTWASMSIWGGFTVDEAGFRLSEAWDVPAYFYVGVPIMALAVALAAFVRPERPWRWPVWLVGGHQLGVLAFGLGMQSGLSLLLLAIILGIMLTVGFAIPAMVGAMAAKALAERVY